MGRTGWSTLSPVAFDEQRKRSLIWLLFIVLAILAILAAIIAVGHYSRQPTLTSPPLVILFSFDGFRNLYLQDPLLKDAHPTFDLLGAQGVFHPIQPRFPSETFPNHYSIATGLYPESHGIVSNSFYDPEFKQNFSLGCSSCQKDPKWWLGEPIWTTVVKQNKKAMVYFWPGSEAPHEGIFPNRYYNYSDKEPYSIRTKQVIEWAHLPLEERPSLIMVYYPEIDHVGHQDGPDDTPDIAKAISTMDDCLKQVLEGVQDIQNVTLLVVSDHGMASLVPGKSIGLQGRVSDQLFSQVMFGGSGTLSQIWNQSDSTPSGWDKDFKKQLKQNISETNVNITVWQKKDIPAEFHYQGSPRIAPVIVSADIGYMVSRVPNTISSKGNHGYNNSLPEMQGIFYAVGPLFGTGVQNQVSTPNLNLYNIICKVLELEPAPNNGTKAEEIPNLWKK